MAELLKIEHLKKSFGGVEPLKDVSLVLKQAEIMLLSGENGAGKTTLFNMITGLERPSSGTVIFDGHDLGNLNGLHISRLGITRLFQHTRLFGNLSVLDNLIVAAHQPYSGTLSNIVFRSRAVRMEKKKIKEQAILCLEKFGLQRLGAMLAGQLSYGQQKLIAFCMLTMNGVKLMLLDEPFAGLSPQMIDKFSEMILSINSHGASFMIVEHNINKTLPICHRQLVLRNGRVLTETT